MPRPILILLGFLLPALAAGGTRIVHHEVPPDWHFEAAGTAADGGLLTFTGFGRAWQLELTANARLAAQLGSGGDETLPALYRGRILGAPDSWLRLTRDTAGRWRGALWDGSELFAVEQPDAVAGRTELPIGSAPGPVLFRLDDLRVEPGTITCAVDGAAAAPAPTGTAKAGYEALVAELAKTAEQRIDIAVFGDAAFGARHADPLAALATRINTIDGIFSEQVGIAINVTRFRAFGIDDDPFTDATDANTLLANLGSYKSNQPDLRGLGLVHLYTGRNLDDSTAGIAYTNALCSGRFGAALSEGRRTVITDSLIGAHEIGHNFGAPHDGEDGSPCESTPQTFLMAPRVNGSSTFSACSLEQMAPEIAAATCLGPVYDIDLAVSARVSADTIFEDETIDLDVTATNLGSAGADGVSLRVTLPPMIRLVDAGEICTAGPDGADCPLGAVAAGGSAGATLQLAGGSPGTGLIRVAVSADSDRDPTNDLASVPVTVEAAVDLAVSLQSPASLLPGATARLEVLVTNASVRDGTDVVATVTLPTLLTVRGTAPAGVDCTLGATEVVCRTAVLSGDDAFAFGIDVTAARQGSGTIAARVTGAESDPDETDNRASRSLEVGGAAAATTGGGGGGGGSALWLLLALLPALAVRRRR